MLQTSLQTQIILMRVIRLIRCCYSSVGIIRNTLTLVIFKVH